MRVMRLFRGDDPSACAVLGVDDDLDADVVHHAVDEGQVARSILLVLTPDREALDEHRHLHFELLTHAGVERIDKRRHIPADYGLGGNAAARCPAGVAGLEILAAGDAGDTSKPILHITCKSVS